MFYEAQKNTYRKDQVKGKEKIFHTFHARFHVDEMFGETPLSDPRYLLTVVVVAAVQNK